MKQGGGNEDRVQLSSWLGLRVEVSGFGPHGSGLRLQGSGFRPHGLLGISFTF